MKKIEPKVVDRKTTITEKAIYEIKVSDFLSRMGIDCDDLHSFSVDSAYTRNLDDILTFQVRSTISEEDHIDRDSLAPAGDLTSTSSERKDYLLNNIGKDKFTVEDVKKLMLEKFLVSDRTLERDLKELLEDKLLLKRVHGIYEKVPVPLERDGNFDIVANGDNTVGDPISVDAKGQVDIDFTKSNVQELTTYEYINEYRNGKMFNNKFPSVAEVEIIEYLQSVGKPLHIDQIHRHIKDRSNLTKPSVNAYCSNLYLNKLLSREGKGTYKYNDEKFSVKFLRKPYVA